MKWRSIKWKPAATWEDRVSCMKFITGEADPAMPSEFFINERWVDDREQG